MLCLICLFILFSIPLASATTVDINNSVSGSIIELYDGDFLFDSDTTTTEDVSIMCFQGSTITLGDVVISSNGCALSFLGLGNRLILDGNCILETVHLDEPCIRVEKGTQLSIYGNGSLSATASYAAAGIGGGSYKDGGVIDIYSGTITATGGKYAPGIGGGMSGAGCTITIYSGNITATGGELAAGIGTGFNTQDIYSGNITIYGGIINATGKAYITSGGIKGIGGAGIGTAYGSSGLDINIYGGTINATGVVVVLESVVDVVNAEVTLIYPEEILPQLVKEAALESVAVAVVPILLFQVEQFQHMVATMELE